MDTATEQTQVVALAHVTGFAAACEGRPNMAVFQVLSSYYAVAERAAGLAGGRVVKYMGDAVLFAFPEHAVRSAVTALEEFRSTASETWRNFDAACGIEVNIHFGTVAAGDFELAGDKRFDVVGKAVNDLFRMPWNGVQLSPELRNLIES